MSHFDIRDWTDFVRGVAPASAQVVMEQHRSRCGECAQLVDLLQRVVARSKSDLSAEPPADVVAQALAIFPSKPEAERSEWMGWSRLAARLIYDSLQDPVLAGVRSAGTTARQLMYRAGSYYVDVRIDEEAVEKDVTSPSREIVTLVGQIVDESTPGQPLKDVPVVVYTGDEIVARSLTNMFGEFTVEYQVNNNQRLSLPMAASGARIEIPLDRLTE